MEPRIQYAKTSDGVNIAYSEAGEGKPLISVGGPAFAHAQLGWKMFAHVYGPLASRFRVVEFDFRGGGLSDREAIDFSMEAMIRDLEAVVARADVDSFVLVAVSSAVPIAVTYAVAHPERVSHLVLCDGFASFSDVMASPAFKVMASMVGMDWVLFTETHTQVLWGTAHQSFGRQFAEFMRACAEPQAHRAAFMAAARYDVAALLPQVAAPTLVVHNRDHRLFPLALGKRIAGAIPGARLAVIDDITWAPVPGLIEEFVYGVQGRPTSLADLPSGTAVILFADIADSTALTERLGDAAFRAKARDLDAALRTVIREHAGTPIEGKLLGDGVIAVFTSARQAIEAALACGAAGSDADLPLHLGLHAGDVIREENNVYGGAVNIASRISGLSAPGEVLVSDTVRSLARTSAGVSFEDRGEQTLKGVGEPVRVWAVVTGGAIPG